MADEQNDLYWMKQALVLAERALGRVAPNPAVGAVIVRDGQVVGQGWTCPPGGHHAEIVALREAGERARGATLYVSLEPCAHFGRTPPCVDALLAARLRRVVVAVRDPFPAVDGRGIRRLREQGVEVTVGLAASEATDLNVGFFRRVLSGRPTVTAKFASSLDGKIATHTGHSRWITGPEARRQAHRLRDRHDAILVGIGTVLADDPLLTTRLPDEEAGEGGPHHPLRVVLDSLARLPVGAAMLRSDTPGNTLVAVTQRAPEFAVAGLRAAGADVIVVPERAGRIDPDALLRSLAGRGINSVLIEGGGQIHGSFFDAGLVDRVVAFVAPVVIGGHGAPAAIAGLGAVTMNHATRLSGLEIERLGDDLMLTGRVGDPLVVEEPECSLELSRRSDESSRSTRLAATTH